MVGRTVMVRKIRLTDSCGAWHGIEPEMGTTNKSEESREPTPETATVARPTAVGKVANVSAGPSTINHNAQTYTQIGREAEEEEEHTEAERDQEPVHTYPRETTAPPPPLPKHQYYPR